MILFNKKTYLIALVSVICYTSCKKTIGDTMPDTTGNPPVDTTTQTTGTTPVQTLPAVLFDNDNMLLGDPGNAQPVTDSFNNYLMRKTWYAVSYNRSKGEPNWVSWHLYANDLGTVSRQDNFSPDTALPAGWYEVQDASYTGSGFDRGHNCPSGDRNATVDENTSTFIMTNIIPQAPVNNQNTWNGMEDSIRAVIIKGYEAYIIMGNYGTGGSGTYGYETTIDNGNVNVPAHIWKVVVLIQNGNDDTSRINNDTRIIAVDVPNINTVNADWKVYRTSVDAIEASTGYNLLSRLPVAIQAVVEARVDNL